MKAEIYSKKNCVFCVQAKQLLTKKNIPYTEYVLDENCTREHFFSKFPTAKTVPQIIIDGEHIPGFEQLTEWIEKNDKPEFLQD